MELRGACILSLNLKRFLLFIFSANMNSVGFVWSSGKSTALLLEVTSGIIDSYSSYNCDNEVHGFKAEISVTAI